LSANRLPKLGFKSKPDQQESRSHFADIPWGDWLNVY